MGTGGIFPIQPFHFHFRNSRRDSDCVGFKERHELFMELLQSNKCSRVRELILKLRHWDFWYLSDNYRTYFTLKQENIAVIHANFHSCFRQWPQREMFNPLSRPKKERKMIYFYRSFFSSRVSFSNRLNKVKRQK